MIAPEGTSIRQDNLPARTAGEGALAPVLTGRWVVFRRADLVGRTVTVTVK
jgi:hypothetical protein